MLQDLLGNEYEVIEEGLVARTFVACEAGKEYRSGIIHLKSILRTHGFLDVVIVMLGTNDMKIAFGLSAEEIGEHLERTIELIQKEEVKNILVVVPPAVVTPLSGTLDERMVNALEISKELPELYREVADKYGCLYLNAGKEITLEDTDGYHLNAEHHGKLGRMVCEVLQL